MRAPLPAGPSGQGTPAGETPPAQSQATLKTMWSSGRGRGGQPRETRPVPSVSSSSSASSPSTWWMSASPWCPCSSGTMASALRPCWPGYCRHRAQASPSHCSWPARVGSCSCCTSQVRGQAGHTLGFPGGSLSKESACNAGDLSPIPGLGRSPGEGHGNPLQYSCLDANTLEW